jgi:hypothetical protein
MLIFNLRKIQKPVLGLLSVALMQLGCAKPLPPQNACGFVQNAVGQRVTWNASLPVKMYIDKSVPHEFYPAIQSAMNTWQNAIGHPVFQIVGTDSDFPPALDGKNVIYWVRAWDTASIDQQANTTLYWVDNQITEADIRVDATNFVYSISSTPSIEQVDIESLMVHELGHVLGLIHKNATPSVMAKSLPNGVLRRTLFPADMSDVKCSY